MKQYVLRLRLASLAALALLTTPSDARTTYVGPSILISRNIRGGGSPWSSSPFGTRGAQAKPLPHTGSSPQQQTVQTDKTKEETKEAMEAFLTRDSRNTFIARVYAILAGQLLVTALSVVLFGTNPALSQWMRTPGMGVAIPMISLLLSTIAWFTMCMSTNARRKSPTKWNLLALFTLGEALTVGFVSSFYQFRSVCSAMMTTAVAATSVSLYTARQKNPKYDLTQWGAGISSFGLIFLVYGSIQLMQMTGILPAGFMPYNEMLYSLAGATLFSFYLAYHTRLIVAGKHSKYQMSDKDHVFGAMTLYNDIINLFIYILRLIGEDRDM